MDSEIHFDHRRPQNVLGPEEVEEGGGMKEIWKPIKGYAKLYSVSNLGRVKRTGMGGGARVGRILSSGIGGPGYRYTTLWKNNIPKWIAVHQLVAMAFIAFIATSICLSSGTLVVIL